MNLEQLIGEMGFVLITFKFYHVGVVHLSGGNQVRACIILRTCPFSHLVTRGVFPLNRARCMHRYCVYWVDVSVGVVWFLVFVCRCDGPVAGVVGGIL